MSDEDINRDGLNERPSVAWLLWVTDAGTVFFRGLLAGLFPGIGGGGLAVSLTDSTNTATLTQAALFGFCAGLVVKGIERFHLWQTKPENEMPNPFRALPHPAPPVAMVPMKDAERFEKLPEPPKP